MKKLSACIAFTCLYFLAHSQAITSKVSYLKADRLAVTNELPFAEKTVMGAIDQKMGKMGYKGKDAKGFVLYKSVSIPELGKVDYDLYFAAERKSRKQKDNSTLTLLISKGNENFITMDGDAALIVKAMKYVDSLMPDISAFDLELRITEQEEEVKKSEKKHSNLVDDAVSLEKKRKSIEHDIEENKKNQEKQLADIETQKQILETLKASRKQ